MIKYVGVENEYTIFRKRSAESEIATALPDVFDPKFLNRLDPSLRKKLFLFATDEDGSYAGPVLGGTHIWLTNGGKVYLDRGMEYASPECLSVRDAVLAEKAGDRIVDIMSECLGRKECVYLMKRGASDVGRYQHTWGSHENYAVPADQFQRLIDQASLSCAVFGIYIASRQLFSGSGHIGWLGGEYKKRLAFLISPRMHFMNSVINQSTTGGNRSLINTRDEPHMEGNLDGLKRLHVISGDMTRSDWSLYLRLGVTALVLQFLQVAQYSTLDALVSAFSGSAEHILNVAKNASLALSEPSFRKYFGQLFDWQCRLRDAVKTYENEVSEKLPEYAEIFELWSGALDAVRGTSPQTNETFSRRLDYLIRKKWIEEYIGAPIAELGRIEDRSLIHKLLSLDFSYCRVNHHDFYKSLVGAGWAEEMIGQEEAKSFCFSPPAGRAELRTEVAKEIVRLKSLRRISAFEWGSVWFFREFAHSADKSRQKVIIFDDRPLGELKSELETIKRWLVEG